jgi:hypothetical protein
MPAKSVVVTGKSFFESSFFQVRAKYIKKEAFAAARLDVGPYFF